MLFRSREIYKYEKRNALREKRFHCTFHFVVDHFIVPHFNFTNH